MKTNVSPSSDFVHKIEDRKNGGHRNIDHNLLVFNFDIFSHTLESFNFSRVSIKFCSFQLNLRIFINLLSTIYFLHILLEDIYTDFIMD